MRCACAPRADRPRTAGRPRRPLVERSRVRRSVRRRTRPGFTLGRLPAGSRRAAERRTLAIGGAAPAKIALGFDEIGVGRSSPPPAPATASKLTRGGDEGVVAGDAKPAKTSWAWSASAGDGNGQRQPLERLAQAHRAGIPIVREIRGCRNGSRPARGRAPARRQSRDAPRACSLRASARIEAVVARGVDAGPKVATNSADRRIARCFYRPDPKRRRPGLGATAFLLATAVCSLIAVVERGSRAVV